MVRIHRTVRKKNLTEPDNKDSVLSHPEPDIRECEVKWALLLIKLVDVMNSSIAIQNPKG